MLSRIDTNHKKMELEQCMSPIKFELSPDTVDDVLKSFYEIKAKEYILSVYTYNNIDDIYKQWKIFTQAFAFIEKIVCSGIVFEQKSHKLFVDYTKTKSFLKRCQMLIINGYFRINSKNNNVYIPTCIGQITSVAETKEF